MVMSFTIFFNSWSTVYKWKMVQINDTSIYIGFLCVMGYSHGIKNSHSWRENCRSGTSSSLDSMETLPYLVVWEKPDYKLIPAYYHTRGVMMTAVWWYWTVGVWKNNKLVLPWRRKSNSRCVWKRSLCATISWPPSWRHNSLALNQLALSFTTR